MCHLQSLNLLILNSHKGGFLEQSLSKRAVITSDDVAEAVVFILSRPRHVTIRDLVILPQNQDI